MFAGPGIEGAVVLGQPVGYWVIQWGSGSIIGVLGHPVGVLGQLVGDWVIQWGTGSSSGCGRPATDSCRVSGCARGGQAVVHALPCFTADLQGTLMFVLWATCVC